MENFNAENEKENDIESNEEFPEINNNKKSLITCAKLNRYFLIIILCPIFGMITNLFIDLIIDTKIIQRLDFALTFFNCLSYFLAGLFHFIYNFKESVKKENNENNENNESSRSSTKIYIYNEIKNENYNPHRIFMIIILLASLIIIRCLLSTFFYDKNVFEKRLFYFFFIPLFSKIILKENIYKHQYFSILISLCGIIFLLIPVCLKFTTDDIVPNITNFINGISYSLFLVIIKYLVEKYYLSPLKISLFVGIISLFISFIYFIIYSLIKYHDLNYFKDCFDFAQEENKLKLSIYIILLFIFTLIFQLLTLSALFYFSPSLVIITDIINPILEWIVFTIINGANIPDVFLNPIGYLIVLFAALIYNEIIIFNFFGLNKETKKFVNQRLSEEFEEIKEIHDAIISESDN